MPLMMKFAAPLARDGAMRAIGGRKAMRSGGAKAGAIVTAHHRGRRAGREKRRQICEAFAGGS